MPARDVAESFVLWAETLARSTTFQFHLGGGHLVDKGQPLGEGGIRPLGNVKVMDHFAGGATEAIASHTMSDGAELHGRVGLVDGGHYFGATVGKGS